MKALDKIIPTNLTEAIDQLDKISSKEGLKIVDELADREDMSGFHDSVGRWVRNEWGLWSESELKDSMTAMGFTHPDDMSSTILKGLWCKRHNQDFDVSVEIENYKDYWDSVGDKKAYDKVNVST